MKIFYVFAIITAITSIYSLWYMFSIVPVSDLSDLSKHEIKNVVNSSSVQVQRIFTPYEHPFPCYPEGKNAVGKGKDLAGLVYIKVPKCASSTLAGINLRIGHRHVPKSMNITQCAASYLHKEASLLKVTERDKKHTYLWTVIRDPKSQMISNLFFHWRNKNGSYPTLDHFKEYVKHSHKKELDFVNIEKFKEQRYMKDRSTMFQEILNEYDFFGVSERLDESLVALRLLLNLNAGDILYVSAKKSGSYFHNYNKNICRKIPSKMDWPGQEEYFASPKWQEIINPLNELYQAANRSLDLTIQQIGRDEFDKALKEHRYLISLVNEVCAPKAIFPCSDEGVSQWEAAEEECYHKDLGCGYRCLDELYDNYTKSQGY